MKKAGRKTAEELLAELQADPKWVAEQQERERALQERTAAYRKAEAPLVKDLNRAGVAVASVWNLVNSRAPYPVAVPILIEHLRRPYPERVREGIARALAVPEARIGWDSLLEAFREEADTTTIGVKWALALALGAAGSDDVLDEVLLLLRDKGLGENRVPLLPILARSRDRRARELLDELRDDEAIGRDVNKILRNLRMKKQVNMSSLSH
jgi:hypothetical protein